MPHTATTDEAIATIQHLVKNDQLRLLDRGRGRFCVFATCDAAGTLAAFNIDSMQSEPLAKSISMQHALGDHRAMVSMETLKAAVGNGLLSTALAGIQPVPSAFDKAPMAR